MIGPHTGQELKLMLEGKKHLAIFYDVLLPTYNISEEVIPENAFAPYVKNKTLSRFEQNILASNGDTIHYVCFTTPNNQWRAQAFFWAKSEGFSGRRPFDEAYEYFIGRLLGYSEEDIKHFIDNK